MAAHNHCLGAHSRLYSSPQSLYGSPHSFVWNKEALAGGVVRCKPRLVDLSLWVFNVVTFIACAAIFLGKRRCSGGWV